MEKDTIKQHILALREELEQHNYRYYVLSQPSIGDFEFDMKLKELEKLEAENPEFFDPNSPTQRVGSDLNGEFQQVEHRYPMLSLSNTYSETELRDFDQRIRKLTDQPFEYVCELKFDGASISLVYRQGILIQAITRGSGDRGEDVTANVRTIRSIPLKLKGDNIPEELEIRGEILMPYSVFEKLNIDLQKKKKPLLANPRNAASGSLKLKKSKQVAQRMLDAYLYYMLGERLPFEGHFENLQQAASWGCKISEHMRKCANIDEVIDFCREWDKRRHALPVATDGVVVKVNSNHLQKFLGMTAKSPRWATAFKFKAERAATKLHSVIYQVGRTGAVTPVAKLEEVRLAGTKVSRASLHNADIIKNHDLHFGDTVFVEKGGEIIPKIVGVDVLQREASAKPIRFIENCPECSTTLVRKEDESAYYCPNETSCPPQIKGRIEHFASRKAMNIDGLGKELIHLFYEKGLINDVADLFTLKDKMDQLIGLETVKEFEDEIQIDSSIPMERIIFSLKSGLKLDRCELIANQVIDGRDILLWSEDQFGIEPKELSSYKRLISRSKNILIQLIKLKSDKVVPAQVLNILGNIPIEVANVLEDHFEYFYYILKEYRQNRFEHLKFDFFVQNQLDAFFLGKEIDLDRLNHLSINRIQEKTFDNIVESLNRSLSTEFPQVLFSLGIRYVGETVADVLANHFGSVDALINATYDDLIIIPDIGEKIASSVVEYFSNKKNIEIINKLKDAGVQFVISNHQKKNVSEKLKGKSFVITGSFGNSKRRKELGQIIQQNGGRLVSSISKNTDYLLAGENAGPEKLKKADDCDVKIIAEDYLIKNMLDDEY